jgi:hypothetical protein
MAKPPGPVNSAAHTTSLCESAEDQGPHQWRLLALEKSTGTILWNSLGYEGIPGPILTLDAPARQDRTSCLATGRIARVSMVRTLAVITLLNRHDCRC